MKGKATASKANIANNVSTIEKTKDEDKYCFTAYAGTVFKGYVWCLDSGASEHLVSDNSLLRNVRKLKIPVKIQIAKSGVILHADELGDIRVTSVTEHGNVNITIKDVLYVPDLKINLLSVRKLEINGFTVIFKEGKGTVLRESKIMLSQIGNTSYMC